MTRCRRRPGPSCTSVSLRGSKNVVPDIVELDEILGHHLDQAARYKTELGQSDPGLAGRAAERLSAAGRRALWRGDRRAATPLLQRALELTRPGRLDVQLELDFAEAQFSPRAAADIADAAAARARRRGDLVAEAVAHVVAVDYRVEFSADPPIDEWETAAQEALPLLEEAQDHAALARVWFVLGQAANMRGRYEEWGLAREQTTSALSASRSTRSMGRPGRTAPDADRVRRTRLSGLSMMSTPMSPIPCSCSFAGELLAMLGHSNEIWLAAQEASKQLGELGQLDGSDHLAEIARLAGDYEAAAHYLRLHCEGLEARGDRGHLSTYAPTRGRLLCMLGRHDEAEPLAHVGRELGDKKDASTQMVWRQAQALVHANRGEHADAESLAREAVEVAEGTDALNYQGDAYYRPRRGARRRRPHRGSRRGARAGARALRAKEEPGHGRAGEAEAGGAPCPRVLAAARRIPRARSFCNACGAPLEAAPASREQRKTVTVLFCDITGSTALGESTDPEALRALLARYFERMKGILESHGASVEKFIGDAVMAVFGVPQVHEDDALRACRAAVEMRDALPELGLQSAHRPEHRRSGDRNGRASRDRRRRQRRRPAGAGRGARPDPARGRNAGARARRGRDRAGRAARR